MARLVIAFVLALAMPWHAAAAATMIDCQPPGAHEHHVIAATDGAGHAAHHAHGNDAHGNHDLATKAKCHAGASCCATTALPSPAAAFDGTEFSQHFAPPGRVGVAAFLTSGPERPPRSFLA